MRLNRLFSVLAILVLVTACAQGTLYGSKKTTGAEGKFGERVDGVVVGSQRDLAVNVGDRIFFDTDKYTLTAAARDVLSRQAVFLTRHAQLNIQIEGHADERGTREYNLALGERRASSVKDFLVSKGVSSNRISTVSYGKERPAVLGSNPAAWAQNRRAVTVIQ